MVKSLFEIAVLFVGFSFREKVLPDVSGTVSVIQMKDVDEYGGVDENNMDRIVFHPQHERYLLRDGDVLFLSRGSRNTACLIHQFHFDTIAPSHFTIIRTKDNAILPGYLKTYLNHPKIQARIKELSQGTTIQAIPAGDLAKLPIMIPPRDIQETFAELDRLEAQARRLEMKIQSKRRVLIEREMAKCFE